MKLNNKGFAITGILYTLFILFIMILLSILSGLSTKKNIMEKSVESLVDSYKWECIEDTSLTETTETGKYEFTNAEKTKQCYTYLKSGVNLNNSSEITFTNADCNNATVKDSLKFSGNYCKASNG